jgi:hypothetical protein
MKTMKKILIFAMVICLMFALASCAAKVDDTKTTQNALAEGDILTSSAQEQTIPTTAQKSAEEIIADLVLEDGTGVIHPRMSLDVVKAILDQYGLSYEYNDDSESLEVEGGLLYNYLGAKINQTKRGLKVGDPVTKVYELYEGAQEAYTNIEGIVVVFIFNYGQTDFRIVLNSDNTIVKSIAIGSTID